MAVTDVIDQFQALMRGLAGIQSAPDNAPDQLAATLSAVCFAENGQWQINTPEDMRGLHTIIIDLRVPLKSLARAVEQTTPYIDLIPKTILGAVGTASLSAIDTIGNITYEQGAWTVAGIEYFGYRFRVQNVKTRVNL
jgi:hypothetical protein